MEHIRTFIALNLPVDAINKIVEIQGQLREVATNQKMKIGWVAPANMHVTLKFLGEIPQDNAYAVIDLLTQRLASRKVMQLKVKEIGAFPHPAKPRIIWVGLEAQDNALVQLAYDVDSWLEEFGFSKETRKFHPHITLGRVKELGKSEYQYTQGDSQENDSQLSMLQIIEKLKDQEIDQCVAQEVVFYQSVLQRAGAEYTALSRIRLLGGLAP